MSINISNCPCRCPGCHSSYLWKDIGEPLTTDTLDGFVRDYGADITCVCFMGGDADPQYVNMLARYMHREYPSVRVAWYSGRSRIPATVHRPDFDYIKVGPYIRHLGSLKERTTNQRLYKRVSEDEFVDITSRFWEK